MRSLPLSSHAGLIALCASVVVGLAACGSSPEQLKPVPLSPPANVVNAVQLWSAQVGPAGSPLAPHLVAERAFVAASNGTVAALDLRTGQDIWRTELKTPLSAGVGSDGQTAAVVTRENELVALGAAGVKWRVRLPARTSTAPLVAGGRIFVLMSDRSVSAFDAGNGARLWTQSRPSEPLVLEQGGVLLAVGNTLVAGLSARLTGLDPLTGSVRWQTLMASSRGTNEVERLVDLVGSVSREANSVCARAFSAGVGCVEVGQSLPTWSNTANGVHGVSGDQNLVFGSESNGHVLAWKRSNGDVAWQVDRLKNRELTSPLAVGRVVVVGDSDGFVHVLSKEDGRDMARLTTDGSAVVGAPVILDQVLVVQTAKGGVFAWRPQ